MKSFSGFRIRFFLWAVVFFWSFAAVVNVAAAATWVGGDTVWSNGANWLGNIAPSSAEDAIIPSGAPSYPVVASGFLEITNLEIENGASVTLSDGAFVSISGTLTINDGGVFAIPGSSLSGGNIETLDIQTGGAFSITGNDFFLSIGGGNVAGDFSISPLSPSPLATISSFGTFSILSGGTLAIDAGGALTFASAGGIDVGDGGTVTLDGGTLEVQSVSPGLAVASGGVLEMNSGFVQVGGLSLPGAFQNDGEFRLNGGEVQIGSTSSIDNLGTLVWSAGEIRSENDTQSFAWSNSGTIEIRPGGVPSLTNCGFINDGDLVFQPGSTLLVSDISSVGLSSFENSVNGTLEGSGTLEFAPLFPSATNIQLVNNGILSPGGTGAIGTIDLIGDLAHTGTYQAEIASPGGVAEADAVLVQAGSGFGGVAVLDGGLIVDSLDGVFADGQVFPIISYESLSGAFLSTGLTPPDGFAFVTPEVNYGDATSPAVSVSLLATGPQVYIWDGSENNDWFTGENWEPGTVPPSRADILIPSLVPNFPIYPSGNFQGGYGVVTVEGELEIESGATFLATLEIAEGGEVRNFGDLTFQGESTNDGTLNWSGGSLFIEDGSSFTNGEDALLQAENSNAGAILDFTSGTLAEFENDGKYVQTGAGEVRIGVEQFTNNGLLDIQGGRIFIGPTQFPVPQTGSSAVLAGEIKLLNNAEMILDGGNQVFPPPDDPTDAWPISGTGAVVVSGPSPFAPTEFPQISILGNLNLAPGVFLEILSGTVEIGEDFSDPLSFTGGGSVFIGEDDPGNSAQVNLNNDLTVLGPLSLAAGTVDGNGNLFLQGPFEWLGGRLEGFFATNGNPVVQVEDLSATASSFLGDSTASAPLLELIGRDLVILAEMGVGNGRMELGRSANVQIGEEGAAGSAGFFQVENDPAVGMTFAPFESEPGSLYGLTNYATIGGNGKLAFVEGASAAAPFFDNSGTIDPGNSPVGVLIIDEPFYSHGDGEFVVDILGPADSEFDRIEITGFVELGGTLSVALEFDPEFGQEFRFLSHGGIGETIQFDQRNLTIGGETETFENFFEVVPDFENNEFFLRYIAETPLFSTLNLAVNPEGGGTVEANASLADGSAVSLTCPETCQEALRTGTAVVLTAIPEPGYQFVQWLDTAGLISDPFSSSTSLALSQDVTVTAEFVLDQAGTFNLDIAIQPPGSGSVTGQYTLSDFDPETEEPITETISFSCPEECAVAIPAGVGVSLSASPAAGFGFSGWQGVDEANGTSASLFMESNRQVTAAFFQPTPPPVDDNDRDGDGTIDPLDGCPDDPNKIEPGFCGCGEPETDTDGDQTPDCVDDCPEDEDKTEPSLCGCGTPETDSDGDGTPDCVDECPENPEKIEPGLCGCEFSEADSDEDGAPDCIDECPEDPEKTEPGACGCGVSEEDSDGDGAPDCLDECPDDAFKVEPGACGCNVPDTDSDGDQIPDCLDGCPGDPDKSAPGACGCGVPENGDRDGDGVPDCVDRCPDDPGKANPGECGCGIPDIDADADGIPDCQDPDAPLNPDFPPLIPGEPQLIGPADGAFLDSPDVTLEGSIFFTGGAGEGLETHWWFRSADKRCEFRDMQRTTFGGIVKYSPDGLIPGLQYNWRLGYRDPQTGEMVWTDLRTFTIGEPENLDGPEIDPGALLADYEMRTFNAWTVPPDIVALLSEFVGEYDPRFFRIGGWDPELGEYVEFTDELVVFPGRAYWFLAREGLMPEFPGVPVSRDADVNVNLFFSEDKQTGWNQIASPNDADYRWGDVQLVAFEPTDDPNEFRRSFGPVPLSELPEDNPYIDLELWRFVEGAYISMLPGEAESVILGGEGYWVTAKRDNICLVFPKAAQDDLDAEETMMVRTLRNFRRFAADQLGPRTATAQSGSPPPMPMGELNAYDGPPRADRVDSGGGGACFINSASE